MHGDACESAFSHGTVAPEKREGDVMRRWEHMAVGQTDCKSYREAQEWVAKKAIESGDRGYELVGFDISRAGFVQRALARDRDVQAPPGLRPGTLCLGVSSRYDLFTCAFYQEWPP